MTYLIPRFDDCILGGTAVEGSGSLEPDPAQAEAILARAKRLLPEGTRLHVVQHRVGLPSRAALGASRAGARGGAPRRAQLRARGRGRDTLVGLCRGGGRARARRLSG